MDGPATPTPPSGKRRRAWTAVLVLAAAWIAFAIFYHPEQGSDLKAPGLSPSSTQARADFDWPLENLDGTPLNFGQFKGRAVFLNVWATWCPPCRAELPAIAHLAADPRVKDVAFLCVSTDEDASTLREFVADKKMKLPVARASSIPDVFATEGIPATFLIAPDGKIVVSHVGAAQWDDPSIVEYLEKLAKRRP